MAHRTAQVSWSPQVLIRVLVIPFLVAGSSAQAQCRYEVTVIAAPPCGEYATGVSGTAVNDHGHVVGYVQQCSTAADDAFLWTPHDGFVVLPRLAGSGEARPADINNAGDIVGYMTLPGTSLTTAVLWRDGEPMDLGIPPGGNTSAANAINNQGQVVGEWGNSLGEGPAQAAFLWDEGVLSDLVLPLGPFARAFDINDSGQITGHMGDSVTSGAHAFRWTSGETVDLGVGPGSAISSEGRAINVGGEVVGNVYLQHASPPLRHAFLWRDGVMRDLGAFAGASTSVEALGPKHAAPESRALAVNDVGQVVGQSEQPDRAFLWQHGTMVDLDTLIVSDPPISVRNAKAINNHGQILAAYQAKAVLLTPIGRPLTDFDIDCQTGVTDLFVLLVSWGPCSECPADVTGDDLVDEADLLALIDNWG